MNQMSAKAEEAEKRADEAEESLKTVRSSLGNPVTFR